MIEGMVAQLSDRLAAEGGSVEDWNRLIRSLAVLGGRTRRRRSMTRRGRVRATRRSCRPKQAAVESGLRHDLQGSRPSRPPCP